MTLNGDKTLVPWRKQTTSRRRRLRRWTVNIQATVWIGDQAVRKGMVISDAVPTLGFLSRASLHGPLVRIRRDPPLIVDGDDHWFNS